MFDGRTTQNSIYGTAANFCLSS